MTQPFERVDTLGPGVPGYAEAVATMQTKAPNDPAGCAYQAPPNPGA